MKLKERINKDYIVAFKEKDVLKKNLLSTIKGDIQTKEKMPNAKPFEDSDVMRLLNSYVKTLRENLNTNPNDEKSRAELVIVESYLPKEMSESEIVSKINSIILNGATNIGQIMKEFATLQADKKLVSELAKKALS
jgi:uncharacterized protein YqeY